MCPEATVGSLLALLVLTCLSAESRCPAAAEADRQPPGAATRHPLTSAVYSAGIGAA